MIVRNILNAIKELNSKINDLQTQLNNKIDKTISVTTANTNLNDYQAGATGNNLQQNKLEKEKKEG